MITLDKTTLKLPSVGSTDTLTLASPENTMSAEQVTVYAPLDCVVEGKQIHVVPPGAITEEGLTLNFERIALTQNNLVAGWTIPHLSEVKTVSTAPKTDDFDGDEIDTNRWAAMVVAPASITQAGGRLQVLSPETTQGGAVLYRREAIDLVANKTYRWKYRINSEINNANATIFSLVDTEAPTLPSTGASGVYGLSYNQTSTLPGRNITRLTHVITNTAGSSLVGRGTNTTAPTARWFDNASKQFVATGYAPLPIPLNTDLIAIFETSSDRKWSYKLQTADLEQTLVDTGWQDYNGITVFSEAAHLILAADTVTDSTTCSFELDWYDEV